MTAELCEIAFDVWLAVSRGAPLPESLAEFEERRACECDGRDEWSPAARLEALRGLVRWWECHGRRRWCARLMPDNGFEPTSFLNHRPRQSAAKGS